MTRARSIFAIGLLLAMAIWIAPDRVRAHEPNLVEISTTGSFEEASTAIREDLKAKKMAIIRQIHFQDMLAAVEIQSEAAITYETFHPRFGKIIYANDKRAFIEIPLRIHVRETEAGALIRYQQPSSVFAPYEGLEEMARELDGIFKDVVSEATK